VNVLAVFQNKALMAGLIAWLLAQIIKLPLDYMYSRKWNWALLLTTGGMPSSHSALMIGLVLIIYLTEGITTSLFLAISLASIVIVDAMGVRRTAGEEGRIIHQLIRKTKLK